MLSKQKKKLTAKEAGILIAKYGAIAAWAYPIDDLIKLINKLIFHK
ncbi:hypothetical protein MOO45_04915 [Bombilactobacillus folatiphilus]|uniref:Bacteriocin n=1 Tax=Bombilactobacillus folatiphilus TaxID=2923362 RepID=A0ABY4P7J7_9LACO|nr:hypothetical protein [Bombilactobacillus folatiphilus]UQS81566.1 hypothetical protein MOO45_04915 [Bombilactobacillus folatiphilus]